MSIGVRGKGAVLWRGESGIGGSEWYNWGQGVSGIYWGGKRYWGSK